MARPTPFRRLRRALGVLHDLRGEPPAAKIALVGARLRYRRGDAQAALAVVERLRRDGLRSAGCATLHSEALRRLGRADEALVAARDAAERAPTSPRVAKAMGAAAVAAGELEEGIRWLQRVVEEDPWDPSATAALLRAQARAGDAKEALATAARAPSRVAADASVIEARAGALRRLGRAAEATAEYERALRLRPDSPSAVEGLAGALFDAGRDAEALEVVERRVAHEHRPALLAHYERVRARALLRIDRPEEASPHAERAVELDPSSPANHYMRFAVRKALGDLTGALAALETAQQLGDAPRFRSRRALLDGLIRVLSGVWLPELPGEPARLDPASTGRVLHLLDRSMPHRVAGYTVRSLYTMKAQRLAGLDPIVVTRPGFPASEGVEEVPAEESVEGVAHLRIAAPEAADEIGTPEDEYLRHYASHAARLVERLRPAVLQPATSYANAMVALALKRRYDLPVVYEVRGFQEETWASRRRAAHGTDFYEGRQRTETMCMLGADRIVTLAEVMRSEIVARGVDPSRVVVIPNAADVDRFQPQPRNAELARSLGLEGRIVLGYVSTLTGYEGVDVLLRGVKELLDRGHPVGALVVGDGPEREPLERLSAELGIAEHVRLTGRVPHERVLDYYSVIDVFVVPRRDLAVCRLVTPLKPFEAMAMALPLLVSDLPALREIAAPGERGLAFVPEDPQSLAAVAESLIRDETLRRRLGDAANRWVRAERTWSANAERYRELYTDLLAERRLALPAAHEGN